MRMWIILVFVGIRSLYGQEFSPAPFLGMGKTAAAQSGLFSVAANPAGLQHLEGPAVAASYQQHYLKADIATQAVLLGLPAFRTSRIGLSLVKYGLKDISSLLRVGVSWCRVFGEQFAGSVTINYHQYQIRGYGSEKAFSADLGFRYHASDGLQMGLYFKNIGKNIFPTTSDQSIAREIGLGFNYAFSEELIVAADLVQTFPNRLSYRGGCSYAPHPKVVFRAGCLSNPLQYTAGIGLKYKAWRFDWANLFHVKLGSSPQFMMAYAF